MAGLTTHVLDTTHGQPAEGIKITLEEIIGPGLFRFVKQITTNKDGRSDGALISPEEAVVGTYQLTFFVGDYFKSKGTELTDPLFLDEIPIRFSVANPEEHYHVPLLISPYGYSTYRGS